MYFGKQNPARLLNARASSVQEQRSLLCVLEEK